MEVHHHPEVEKKTFKQYLLEGLMIFIAVTMGFFAESVREHITDRAKEKEYIVSMVKELKADSVQLAEVFKDSTRYKKIDTLAVLMLSRDTSLKTMKKIYKLHYYIGSYNAMVFVRNTLTQLKSSGNMRLIRNVGVVDSLNKLDNTISGINDQLDAYKKWSLDMGKEETKIFDYRYFVKDTKWVEKFDSAFANAKKIDYLINDPKAVIAFATQVEDQSSILNLYFMDLQDYSDFSNRLIPFLEKQYGLENEKE